MITGDIYREETTLQFLDMKSYRCINIQLVNKPVVAIRIHHPCMYNFTQPDIFPSPDR
jgi:hypothetical protein